MQCESDPSDHGTVGDVTAQAGNLLLDRRTEFFDPWGFSITQNLDFLCVRDLKLIEVKCIEKS